MRRRMLEERISGFGEDIAPNTLEAHVSRLRVSHASTAGHVAPPVLGFCAAVRAPDDKMIMRMAAVGSIRRQSPLAVRSWFRERRVEFNWR